MILDQTIEGLYHSGARTVALVTGHYAQAHEIEMYEAALRMMDDQEDLRVFAATPLEVLGDDNLLDHAGRYETSQFPQNTRQSTSPPTLATRASASDMTPRGVDRMDMPRPLRIFGRSLIEE